MSLIFSPIIIAWLSQSDAYIIAAIQFLAVYMVYRRYERHRDLVAFKKGLHHCNPLILLLVWLHFVDAYRTVCIAPGPNARAALEAIQKLSVSA
jgi:hypothetical protein